MIIADIHEKNSMVIAFLIEKEIEVQLKSLKVADYIIGDIVIERKTAKDFIASMINKRLLRQVEELKQFEKPLLIVEGSFDFETKIGKAIRGMLASIMLEKIPIIFTENEEETAEWLALLEKKQRKKQKEREISLKAKKKAFSLAEQQRFILESFPGIGPVTARKLLEHFKTIKATINATQEELEKVIKKKSQVMRKLIEAEYLE